jgi:carbon storage regulator
MLTLTRRLGETLVINDTVRITVAAIRGNQVRLSVTAPAEIPVHREEIWLRLQQEDIAAVGR